MSIERWIFPIFILIYAVLSLYVITIFCVTNEFGGDWIGHGYRPIAYRPLVVTLADMLHWIIPDFVREWATPYLVSASQAELSKALISRRIAGHTTQALSVSAIFKTAELMFVVYLTLVALIWVTYKTTRAMLPDSRAYALVAPILLLLIIGILTMGYAYTYDYAELFFSFALLYLLFKERWNLYFVCFAIGTYNKETTLFAIFFYFVFYFPRLPRKIYIARGLLQIAIYAAVKTALTLYYADLPAAFGDSGYIFTWRENFLYLFTYNSYMDLIGLIMIVILLTYRWWEKPLFLRSALWMLLPNAGAYFLTCHAGEYRDLFWSLPVMTMLATHSLVSMGGFDENGRKKKPLP